MRNVAPKEALTRRLRHSLGISFVLIALGVFLVSIGLGLYVFPLVTEASSSVLLYKIFRIMIMFTGILLAIVGLGLSIRAATLRKENEPARLVGESLKSHFDDNFTFIRNINKRQTGYIDAAMVGPPGVLIFRVLDWEGQFLNEGSGWMKPGSGRAWVPTNANPTRQVVEDIKKMRAYLAEYGLNDAPVFGVIVFLHDDPKTKLTLKEPVVPATHLSSLNNRLYEHYMAVQQRIDRKSVDIIVNLLLDT